MLNRVFKSSVAGTACGAGLLFFLGACSGVYHVGTDNGNAAGSTASNAGAGGGPDSSAGAPTSNVSGAPGVAGAGVGPEVATYCGVVLPEETPAPDGDPDVVFERIRLVLKGTADATDTPEPASNGSLRDKAGAYAVQLLNSYPGASPGITRFVEGWLPETPSAETWSGLFRTGTLKDLLTSTAELPGGAGVLTDLSVLSRESIVARSVYVSTRFLCRVPPPPPPAVPPLDTIKPNETRRTHLERFVKPPTCNSCHRVFGPLGYSLEHFSTIGELSNLDNGHPIDSSGSYELQSGTIEFSDVTTLAPQLAQSCEVAMCVARQLRADALSAANLAPAADPKDEDKIVAALGKRFSESDFKLRELVQAVVQGDEFLR